LLFSESLSSNKGRVKPGRLKVLSAKDSRLRVPV